MRIRTFGPLVLALLSSVVAGLWIARSLEPGEDAARPAGLLVPRIERPIATAPANPESVAGELLVDLADDVTDAEVLELERRYAIDLTDNGPASRPIRLMRVSGLGSEEETLRRELARHEHVELVEPNYVYRALHTPNDPLYKYQWHMNQIRSEKAWDLGAGDGVVVAVIDTGVAYEDRDSFKQGRDLKGTKFVPGWNFIHRNDRPNDDHAHGTHVAGTIAQTTDNGEGVTGIAYKAAIMPIKVLSAQGYGNVGDIAESIRWAADHGAHVINMSLGGSGYSRALKNACDYAKGKGVTIVCAAGNNGKQQVSYPAAYPACIAVSATRYDEQITWYSNYGKEICVAAPGGDTRVDQNGDGYPDGVLQNTINRQDPSKDGYELFQGTSMASPHVAGVAALIISKGVRKPDDVRKVLEKTARPKGSGKGDLKYGAGIVDAAAAQKRAVQWAGERRLGIAAAAGTAALWGLRLSAGKLAIFALPALIAGCGLFFLPVAAGLLMPATEALAVLTGLTGNPLLYSALLPLAAMVLLFHRPRLRLVAAGLALGTSAYLIDTALFSALDVAWVPERGWLDAAYLIANAALLLVLCRLAFVRKEARR